MPYVYQQEHAEPREFTPNTFPAVRCREPWWLPSQVRTGIDANALNMLFDHRSIDCN